MKVEEEKDERFMVRNDPSKYSLRSHDAHNSLVHNKGRVCKQSHEPQLPMAEEPPNDEYEGSRTNDGKLS